MQARLRRLSHNNANKGPQNQPGVAAAAKKGKLEERKEGRAGKGAEEAQAM